MDSELSAQSLLTFVISFARLAYAPSELPLPSGAVCALIRYDAFDISLYLLERNV